MNGFLIGRFQPFHLGHLEAVNFALSKVEQLYIGIGSSNKSNQPRNPFTVEERKQMILSSLDKNIIKRVSIYEIPDLDDHSKWVNSVDEIIPNYDIVFSNDDFTLSLYEKKGKELKQRTASNADLPHDSANVIDEYQSDSEETALHQRRND